MKKVLITVLGIVVVLIFIMTYFTLHGRDIRQTELNNALSTSMNNAMEILLMEEGKPEDEEEWKEMFLQALVLQIDSASDLEVRILDADMEKGLLSVEAVLEFQHPMGGAGSVSCQKTAIIEEYFESK